MYSPKFSYTDKAVLSLIKIENSKVLLQNLDLDYNVKQKLIQNARAFDIFHISNMLSVDVSVREADKILNGFKLDEFANDQNKVVMNFKRAADFIRSTDADNFAELDKSILIQVNKIMLNNWRESWEANLRNFSDKIDDRWDSYYKLRDSQMVGTMVDGAVEELIEWYKFAVPTTAPIVRIAVAFYRLIEIAPFIAGNKFSLITILDYLFLKNGFSSRVYSSTAKMLYNFEEKLQKNITATKLTYDLSIWVEAFASAYAKNLIDTREELTNFIADSEKSKQQPFLDLNKRQMKVLKYLQSVPNIRREDYCHMMEVSTMTAFRDLNDLVRKKLLKVDGQGRGTKYKLASM